MQRITPAKSLAAIAALWLSLSLLPGAPVPAHIVPPEVLHPAAESYRRLGFLLALNPVPWESVKADIHLLAGALDESASVDLAAAARQLLAETPGLEDRLPAADLRKRLAADLFELSTRAVATAIQQLLDSARTHLDDYSLATRHLEEARQIWAAFEPALQSTRTHVNPWTAAARLEPTWLRSDS